MSLITRAVGRVRGPDHSAAIADLMQRLAAIETRVAELDDRLERAGETLDALPVELRRSVDDLSTRLARLNDRLEAGGG